jgi:outer membrane protein OmpA-like peptidoglycan-associated protein
LAQVTTDDSALKAITPKAPIAGAALPASGPASGPSAASQPASTPARARRVVHRAPTAHAAKPALPPQVPLAPPPNPVILPPPQVLPVHAPVLPPAITPNPAAPTTATPLAGGTRLVFGAGNSDLNQATLDALQAVAATAKADPEMQITITAWAPGVPEDPSTPHRLSLDRALAARAVLINAGIASERILAIAKGANDIAGGPPDRMDVVAARPRPTPQAAGHS